MYFLWCGSIQNLLYYYKSDEFYKIDTFAGYLYLNIPHSMLLIRFCHKFDLRLNKNFI